jgi:hypothetical protein
MVCDDGNACTDDTCNPTGGCVYTPDDTNTCDDSNACTTGDACSAGSCVGTPMVCDDENACTDDTCNPASGCVYTPDDTNTCDDSNACTTGDACSAGSCVGTPMVCDDGNACTDDTCNPAGGCVYTPDDTNTCDDSNACTTGDACSAGTCVGTPMVCDDGNACTDDTCNPTSGCVYTPDDTNTCDDSNACTTVDLCQGGVCTGSVPVVCTAADQCHLPATCDPGTGACINLPAPDGTACDDGDVETCTDVCTAGTCAGTFVPEPPEVDDSVLLEKKPGGALLIRWDGPPGARYNVYRGSSSPDVPWVYDQSCFEHGISRKSSTDATNPPPGGLFYYLISRMDRCRESALGRNSEGVAIPNNSPCAGTPFTEEGPVTAVFDPSPSGPDQADDDDGEGDGDGARSGTGEAATPVLGTGPQSGESVLNASRGATGEAAPASTGRRSADFHVAAFPPPGSGPMRSGRGKRDGLPDKEPASAAVGTTVALDRSRRTRGWRRRSGPCRPMLRRGLSGAPLPDNRQTPRNVVDGLQAHGLRRTRGSEGAPLESP